jgi:hypothetical protein
MNFVGKTKDSKDSRVLLYDNSEPLCNFVIQCVENIPEENKIKWNSNIFKKSESNTKRGSKERRIEISDHEGENINIIGILEMPELMAFQKFLMHAYNFQAYMFRKFEEAKLIDNSIILPIDCAYCYFKEDIHSGNKRQRLVLNVHSISQRCYSTKREECVKGRHNEIKFDKLPDNIRAIIVKLIGSRHENKKN